MNFRLSPLRIGTRNLTGLSCGALPHTISSIAAFVRWEKFLWRLTFRIASCYLGTMLGGFREGWPWNFEFTLRPNKVLKFIAVGPPHICDFSGRKQFPWELRSQVGYHPKFVCMLEIGLKFMQINRCYYFGVPVWLFRLRTWHCLCEDEGLIPGLPEWVKDPGFPQAAVGCRCSLGQVWLWCSLAAAALIWPLAWKLPYATGVAIKIKYFWNKRFVYGPLKKCLPLMLGGKKSKHLNKNIKI